jgi:hypothetical protein
MNEKNGIGTAAKIGTTMAMLDGGITIELAVNTFVVRPASKCGPLQERFGHVPRC